VTEVFLTLSVLYFSFKANVRVNFAKTGHGPHSFKLVVICVALVLFVCKCVLYYCHQMTNQLHLTNMSISINGGLLQYAVG
jgi:hypothetical protein